MQQKTRRYKQNKTNTYWLPVTVIQLYWVFQI